MAFVVVLQGLGFVAVVDVVGRICPANVGHVATHKLPEHSDGGGIAADDAVLAENPDVTKHGDGPLIKRRRPFRVLRRFASGVVKPGVQLFVFESDEIEGKA